MRRAVRLGCGVTHTGTRIHVAMTAVVDMRALARERPIPDAPSEQTQEVLEPQEKAEPNVGTPVAASPFDALLQRPVSAEPTPSPYVSESFLAQADAPPVGATKTESPPDTNGAVGRDKLMVP